MQLESMTETPIIHPMEYLTPSQLRKEAPAVARLPERVDNLIDTAAFLRSIGNAGYKPIMAVQGTSHSDEGKAKGRHLAVALHSDGSVLAILNSHTVWRRAWLGIGFLWNSEYSPTLHMLGAVVPLPRWRGYDEPLATLQAYGAGLREARDSLVAWMPTIHEKRWMARKLAVAAYLKGHRTPRPQALLAKAGDNESAWDFLGIAMAAILNGGLEPEPPGLAAPKPRRLKPVLSPDGTMLASSAAFQVGLAAMRKYGKSTHAFPAFRSAE